MPALVRPDPRDRTLVIERELLKLALQYPNLLDDGFNQLPVDFFSHPAYRAVRTSIATAGGIDGLAEDDWIARVSDHAANDAVRSMIRELAVEPMPIGGGALERYGREQLARAQGQALSRTIEELRSRMQRLETNDADAHAEVFAELVRLEADRRVLKEQAYGSD